MNLTTRKPTYLRLRDYFGDPMPKGTQARLNAQTPGWAVPRTVRKQIKQRRKQGARARCKR